MNQTQVNSFLKCLLQIDDLNYLALHEHAKAFNNGIHSHHHHHHHDHDHHDSINYTNARQVDDDDHDHDHDHDDENSSDTDLLVAKVTAMLVLFLASALCGSIPFLLNRCFRWTENNTNARSATVVKCLLYFGGGVLLCTTFLHLLPEVQETVEQLQECGSLPELSFSLAEMLMCCGFLMMYLLEEVIHSCIHRHKRMMEKDAGAGAAFERAHSIRNSFLVKPKKDGIDNAAMEGCIVTNGSHAPTAPKAPGTLSVQDLILHEEFSAKYAQSEQDLNRSMTTKNNNVPHHHYHEHQHQGHGHSHTHLPTSDMHGDHMIASSLRGFLIVLALSLHELFEGMAIGLESSAGSVWFMFGAVSAHKLVLAFCVGVELIVARTRIALSIVYVLTFAVVSPIGIGIGILISNSNNSSAPGIPSAILQGLACGTLLYVVFFEILSKNHAGLLAYVSLVVGFVVMFGLQRISADGHGHSHGSCSSSSDDHDHDHDHDDHDDHDDQDTANTFEQQLHLLREASKKLLQESNN